MILRVRKSSIKGRICIPGSKSHTIRALYIASFAHGESRIIDPLRSGDTESALMVCRMFGAGIKEEADGYLVQGFGAKPGIPENVIDVGNSGTSLRIGLSTAALGSGATVFTGDEQIRKRPLKPLIEALNNLGAQVFSTRGNGMAPVVVKGTIKGGKTPLEAVTSQYLSSLLLNCPLAQDKTEITVTKLNEKPYVDMTLWWLDKQGIEYRNDDYTVFTIPGGQSYKPFTLSIPADFSSATFFFVLAAVSGGEIVFENLDMSDPQGDKEVLSVLKAMGADVTIDDNTVRVKGNGLKGIEVDMNAIPDALPSLAVAGCFAQGETKLLNVPQAREKETDRIKVMHDELSKMGADIEELEDGLIVRQSRLTGTLLKGYHDHRVVMALAVAGLNAEGDTVIDTAEAVEITFPGFIELITECGGNISI